MPSPEPIRCSIGECRQPARLYEHDGGIFAYCAPHAVGTPIGRDDEQELATIHGRGHHELYIDGGSTIQSFLKEDLIDKMIITVLPILLGGGSPLFGDLPEPLEFEHVKTELMLSAMVQSHYRRRR